MLGEKEINIISKLIIAVPKMSEFNKGYLLGMIETITDKRQECEKQELQQIN